MNDVFTDATALCKYMVSISMTFSYMPVLLSKGGILGGRCPYILELVQFISEVMNSRTPKCPLLHKSLCASNFFKVFRYTMGGGQTTESI